MATNPFLGAALAALFSLGLTAQDGKSFEQHMAAAKLAQTRGDHAAALKELRAAQAVAPADQREQLQRTVQDLVDSMGVDLAREPRAGDPVQRLIAVLDTGSRADAAVNSAYDQLSYLGALVVPPLLDAVPTFGPFGLRNALLLLAVHDDARIAKELAQRLDDADPAVTAAIVDFLGDAPPSVAVPLAVKVAATSKDPGQLLEALRKLVDDDRENPAARAAAEKIVTSESPKVLAELLDSIDSCRAAWVPDLLDRLRQRGDDKTRGLATFFWLKRQRTLTQDLVLQAVQSAPEGRRCWIASIFLSEHPDWNRVALLALRSAAEEVVEGKERALDGIGGVKWGDLRDEAGAAMLELPRTGNPRTLNLRSMAAAIIEAGWIVPEGKEVSLLDLLGQGGPKAWEILIDAMPKDGEDRALRLWHGLPREQQDGFAFAVKGLRPWHRLVATHLITSERQEAVNPRLFERDWSGAPSPAIAALTELATRWPTPPLGSTGWQPALCTAWSRSPDMPAEVILPLIEGGNREAWNALSRRDPERALAWLRTATNRDAADVIDVIDLLRRFGTDQDVPLAIWVVHQLGGQPPNGLPDFLAMHGRGNVDVIRLGAIPITAREIMTSFCISTATRAAQFAQIADLGALLELVPSLPGPTADAVLEALAPQLTASHSGALADALDKAMQRPEPASATSATPIDNLSLRVGLLGSLAKTGDPQVLPRLRRLLERDDLQADILRRTADTCLAVAGGKRRELLAEMLRSARVPVLTAALGADELRDDGELRQLAQAGILKLGAELPVGLPAQLVDGDLEALAKALVDSDRWPALHQEIASSAMAALGKRKDATFLAQLARGARHPRAKVREAAAAQLGGTFSREAAPYLLDLLKDDAPGVQDSAKAALDRIASYLDERRQWEERLK